MAGRKRTGTLIWTGKAYSVRFANGKSIPLETSDRRVAQARRRALANDPTAAAPTTPIETFEEAANIRVQKLLDAKVPSAKDRASRLRRWAYPIIGQMLVTEIKPGHITSVLEHVASLGKSSTTLTHMRGDLIFVFGRLLKEEIITRNPARGDLVDTPPGNDDPRPRVLLRDEEFVAFVEAPTTPPQLRMMAIVSRAFGGMRTSDLRAWEWGHVDLPPPGGPPGTGWAWADVPRPKTSKKRKRLPGEPAYILERLEMPPLVAAEVRAWWESSGRPASRSVFTFPPARKSYAADLRAALLAAGIDRHDLHHNTERTKRVDFHSFRRAWSTAIGAAGLNAQTAMKVTGHRQLSTHMRYVRPEVIGIPSAAIPTWGPRALPAGTPPGVLQEIKNASRLIECPPEAPPGVIYKYTESLQCEGQDLNLHALSDTSTSIQSDPTQSGTEVQRFGTEPAGSAVVIEPNRTGSVPGWLGCGQRGVVLKTSFCDQQAKIAPGSARVAAEVLRTYLRARADAVCAAAGWIGAECGALQ